MPFRHNELLGDFVSDASASVAAGAAAATNEDERLAYRSVFQRLFVRPEVGAIIGAVGVWTFFWAVSNTFGTAGASFAWIDIVASSLGIMAVSVAMLMIGGEFDLSSGAMTGATAMLTVFIVKETGELGGLGLPMSVSLLIGLVIALGIGWLNGTMVERTGQPSFIITLATFFALRGLKLGLANKFVGQIQVASTEEASDYDFWRPIFAGEWERNTHILESRDFFYILFSIVGVCLIVLAVAELWFERRQQLQPAGLLQFVAGVAAGIGGILVMHNTDGTGANAGAGALIGLGILVGLHGFCQWRYEPVANRGAVQMDAQMRRRLVGGFVALGLGAVAAFVIDSADNSDIIFPVTVQGLRAILFASLVAVGLGLLALASQSALSVNPATKMVATLALAVGVVIVALTIFFDSSAPKFRASLFTILLLIAALITTWAIVVSRFTERRYVDRPTDRVGYAVGLVGLLSVLIGIFFRLLFVVQAELDAGIPPTKTSVRVLWFVAFTGLMVWVLARTRFGSWTFAVGGNKEAARQVGVPAARTKTQLFMIVSVAAWLVGVLLAFRINSIQANTGDGEEFEYIIAAVVGGCLLTGGYGSVFGASIGAMIMAMPLIGISAARWNTDWRFLFVGVILLLAVVSNRYIRLRAEALRR